MQRPSSRGGAPLDGSGLARPMSRGGLNPLGSAGPVNPFAYNANPHFTGNMGMVPGPIPGTSSGRNIPPGTAIRNRPMSGIRRPPGTGMVNDAGPVYPSVGMSTDVHVADRPVTQQGMMGIKTGVAGRGRQIFDASYYRSQLTAKMGEITAEITKFKNEIDEIQKNNNQYAQLERRYETLIKEVRRLEGELADYNLTIDKMRTDTRPEEILNVYHMLKAKNDRDQKQLNQVFLERKQQEDRIHEIEEQINDIQKNAEVRLNELDPDQRQEYDQLLDIQKQQQADLLSQRTELEETKSRLAQAEAQLKSDTLRQKAQTLRDQRAHLLAKKADLEIQTNQAQLSVPEARERLLAKVKEDNAEIAKGEQKALQLKGLIEKYKRQVNDMETDLEERKGEAGEVEKYTILFQKDQEMTNFIEKFEETKSQELAQKEEMERTVVALLEHISRNLGRENSMPTPSQVDELKAELQYKGDQLASSQATQSRLQAELEKRNADLEKINTLDSKISLELHSLSDKIISMEHDLKHTFNNVDSVREKAETTKRQLVQQKQALMARRDVLKQQISFFSMKFEGRKQQLSENETHTILESMEQKIKQYEQNIFHLKQFIDSKSREGNFQPVVQECGKLTSQINKLIIKHIQAFPGGLER
eukprot:GILK01001490.1.p1 GENE.GILK01001490.1~~GILK01001490.1.p1  ORF type:complete len:646 (+),score=138.74 GILK01001490.1:56-1993(+)